MSVRYTVSTYTWARTPRGTSQPKLVPKFEKREASRKTAALFSFRSPCHRKNTFCTQTRPKKSGHRVADKINRGQTTGVQQALVFLGTTSRRQGTGRGGDVGECGQPLFRYIVSLFVQERKLIQNLQFCSCYQQLRPVNILYTSVQDASHTSAPFCFLVLLLGRTLSREFKKYCTPSDFFNSAKTAVFAEMAGPSQSCSRPQQNHLAATEGFRNPWQLIYLYQRTPVKVVYSRLSDWRLYFMSPTSKLGWLPSILRNISHTQVQEAIDHHPQKNWCTLVH